MHRDYAIVYTTHTKEVSVSARSSDEQTNTLLLFKSCLLGLLVSKVGTAALLSIVCHLVLLVLFIYLFIYLFYFLLQ
jgi:hypothetical protein